MVVDGENAARMIMRAFPGWRCFYGPKTDKWWGVPPPRHPVQALFEADTTEDLAALIHRAGTGPRS
ncbi:MAG: hypothetical protein JWL97_4192 [Gemmatimonadales bacterium]|nr:hypothetical protein [Gemmatimonadales bacterium]